MALIAASQAEGELLFPRTTGCLDSEKLKLVFSNLNPPKITFYCSFELKGIPRSSSGFLSLIFTETPGFNPSPLNGMAWN